MDNIPDNTNVYFEISVENVLAEYPRLATTDAERIIQELNINQRYYLRHLINLAVQADFKK